jgi:hypothetical protein
VKRYLPVTLVVVGFVAGLALLLLALDIARAERELQRDDARFLAQPRVPGYWEANGLLPLDLGRRVLGVQDDVERRRAVQLFWRAHPRDYTPPTPTRLAQRAQVQAALAETDAGSGPAASQTATLLGVLALLTPPEDAEVTQVLNAAAAAFRRAIAFDPTNEDAKHNLESVLWTGQRQSRGRGGGTSTSGSPREYGGAAASNRGSGY